MYKEYTKIEENSSIIIEYSMENYPCKNYYIVVINISDIS